MDLTKVSPSLDLRNGGFSVRQVALKVTSCKVTKHKKKCIKNQHVFVSFVFDTFGFLVLEAIDLLNKSTGDV